MDKRFNYLRHAAIYCYILLNPGSKKADIAKGLGLHRSTVGRLLLTVNCRGLLLYIDEKDGLYMFDN